MAARAVIGELDVSTARIDCPSQHRWRFTRGPLTSTVFTALHVLPKENFRAIRSSSKLRTFRAGHP